jgi:hypothetical protein
MGDSDDDYESTMNKRRGQSRNKFRNERDDFIKNNNNGDVAIHDPMNNNNELKRKDRDFNGNNNNLRQHPSNNRRPAFDNNYGDDFNRFGRPYPPNPR